MAKAVKRKEKNKKLGKISLPVLFLFGAIIALPTTIVLCVGAMPSIVAFFTDKTRRKARAIAITAMNLAACSLYLLKLWAHGNDFHYALSVISDPFAIVVMYVGAAAGYVIDWFLSGAISQVLYAKAKARQKEIGKRQDALVKRWGAQISGQESPLESLEDEGAEEDKTPQPKEASKTVNQELVTNG